MKKILFIVLCLAGLTAYALTPPVDLPDVGGGRLKVFAQNVQNYYFHYDNYESTRANYDHEAFAEKTHRMVDAMMMVDADIFALCEVEAQEIVLRQLADSMNMRVQGEPYVAVEDGINEAWDPEYDNNIKSGFIYRKDKVQPVGSCYPASTYTYYRNTMRIQAFEELATGEQFTMAMNHFKSKIGGGEEKRITNAQHLLKAIKKYASDPDVLILGDLNCEEWEQPITIIKDAGYKELLIKYNPDAYSHCYGGGELIDHVLANASMEEQVTGAGVFHISTACGTDGAKNANYRYSDHDPYIVCLCLGAEECPTAIETVPAQPRAKKTIENGQLIIILPDGSIFDAFGRRLL